MMMQHRQTSQNSKQCLNIAPTSTYFEPNLLQADWCMTQSCGFNRTVVGIITCHIWIYGLYLACHINASWDDDKFTMNGPRQFCCMAYKEKETATSTDANKVDMVLTQRGLLTPFGVGDLGNTGSGNGLLPDSTKPLPEPMLTHHQKGSVAFIRRHYNEKIWRYQSVKQNWKLHFKNHIKISQGPMSQK